MKYRKHSLRTTSGKLLAQEIVISV